MIEPRVPVQRTEIGGAQGLLTRFTGQLEWRPPKLDAPLVAEGRLFVTPSGPFSRAHLGAP